MSNNPQTDRIPLGHSVRYAVRGLPEVPNQYGPGTLEPREITLTYRAAPDSQLGRVHAYVAGRIWVNGAELPLLPGGLYGQHYDDVLDGWPEWLAEEARLHDPAVLPAVPVPPTTHAVDRAAVLRGAADALHERGKPVCVEEDGDCCWFDAVRELRRMAAEAQQQPDTETARAYPDCERCGDTAIDPDGGPCEECQQHDVPAVSGRPAADDSSEETDRG